VVFAFSILGRIAIVEQTPSLFASPPEWNQTPENAFTGCVLFDDDLESSFFEDGYKFIIGHGHSEFFPSPMSVAPFPVMGFLDALHTGLTPRFGARGRGV
jgi:hypothetical protein